MVEEKYKNLFTSFAVEKKKKSNEKREKQRKGPENKGNKEENELFLCDYIGGMG